MPNYSFKGTYFLSYGGGSMTDSGLPTTLHTHYDGHTMTSFWPHHTSCWPNHKFCWPRIAHCVSHTEYDKKPLADSLGDPEI